jgi:hypothetical protein
VHELAVLLVLNVDNAPAVFATPDGLAVHEHRPLGADDGEGDHVLRVWSVLSGNILGLSATYPNGVVELDFFVVIVLSVEGVETDVVVHHFSTDLQHAYLFLAQIHFTTSTFTHSLTTCLNCSLSSRVKLSDLARTGTTFTTSLSFFITMISMGRIVCPVGLMKYRQQWMRVSWMWRSRMAVSSLRR